MVIHSVDYDGPAYLVGASKFIDSGLICERKDKMKMINRAEIIFTEKRQNQRKWVDSDSSLGWFFEFEWNGCHSPHEFQSNQLECVRITYSIGLCGDVDCFGVLFDICRLCVSGVCPIHFCLEFVNQILLNPDSTIFVVQLALFERNIIQKAKSIKIRIGNGDWGPCLKLQTIYRYGYTRIINQN